jgi:hypothetical protein
MEINFNDWVWLLLFISFLKNEKHPFTQNEQNNLAMVFDFKIDFSNPIMNFMSPEKEGCFNCKFMYVKDENMGCSLHSLKPYHCKDWKLKEEK